MMKTNSEAKFRVRYIKAQMRLSKKKKLSEKDKVGGKAEDDASVGETHYYPEMRALIEDKRGGL